MPKNLTKGTRIADDTITGADINDSIGIYDETDNYSIGDVVFWKAEKYEAKSLITGGTAGDFSNAPDVSSDWEIVEDTVILDSTSSNIAKTTATYTLDTNSIIKLEVNAIYKSANHRAYFRLTGLFYRESLQAEQLGATYSDPTIRSDENIDVYFSTSINDINIQIKGLSESASWKTLVKKIDL